MYSEPSKQQGWIVRKRTWQAYSSESLKHIRRILELKAKYLLSEALAELEKALSLLSPKPHNSFKPFGLYEFGSWEITDVTPNR